MEAAGETQEQSDSGAAAGNGTNGNSSGKEPSILVKIREEWVEAGSKLPSSEEGKKMVAAYTASQVKVAELEAKLEKARGDEYKAVEKLARAYGAKTLRIDGIQHDFACRGTTVFFKRKTGAEVIDL